MISSKKLLPAVYLCLTALIFYLIGYSISQHLCLKSAYFPADMRRYLPLSGDKSQLDAILSSNPTLDPESILHLHHYGIIFDAGSSGTRIHVYTFTKDGDSYTIHDEKMKKTTPGLSSFADNPTDVEPGLKDLLQYAMDEIPADLHAKTPLILRATAGFRSIPQDKADVLLNQVRHIFDKSPFNAPGASSASVLEGVAEGLYAWVTINYLLGNLGKPHEQTTGILDLGGASTQIAFAVSEEEASMIDEKYIVKKVYNARLYFIYVHSYLYYGLNEARRRIFDFTDGADESNASQSASSSENMTPLPQRVAYIDDMNLHECLPVNYEGFFMDKELKKPQDLPENAEDALNELLLEKINAYNAVNKKKREDNVCEEKVRNIFESKTKCSASKSTTSSIEAPKNTEGPDDILDEQESSSLISDKERKATREIICTFEGVPQPNVHGRNFYAFSFYYDKAMDFNLLDLVDSEKGYVLRENPSLSEYNEYLSHRITPKHYRVVADDVCSLETNEISTKFGIDEEYIPYMCADNNYIYNLLTHFGFSEDTKYLTIAKKITGFEVGWCIGAILDYLATEQLKM